MLLRQTRERPFTGAGASDSRARGGRLTYQPSGISSAFGGIHSPLGCVATRVGMRGRSRVWAVGWGWGGLKAAAAGRTFGVREAGQGGLV